MLPKSYSLSILFLLATFVLLSLEVQEASVEAATFIGFTVNYNRFSNHGITTVHRRPNGKLLSELLSPKLSVLKTSALPEIEYGFNKLRSPIFRFLPVKNVFITIVVAFVLYQLHEYFYSKILLPVATKEMERLAKELGIWEYYEKQLLPGETLAMRRDLIKQLSPIIIPYQRQVNSKLRQKALSDFVWVSKGGEPESPLKTDDDNEK